MKRSSLVRKLTLLTVLLMSVLISSCNSGLRQEGAQLTLLDRVIKSGSIRCAYIVYPPAVFKDPNTGKLSGVFIDAMELSGKNLGLKVEWTEEVGWGTMIEGLVAKRYDLVVCQIWPSATRAKLVDFSSPLYYSAVGVFVRPDDLRFVGNLKEINSGAVKIATVDGEMSDIIATNQFPEAGKFALPQSSDVSQLMLNVADRKADVTFLDLPPALRFMKNNPSKVKNIATEHPIRVFPSCMMYPKGEVEFGSMIDRALNELINAGYIDGLIDRYEEIPGSVYKIAYPYRTSSQ